MHGRVDKLTGRAFPTAAEISDGPQNENISGVAAEAELVRGCDGGVGPPIKKFVTI